MLKPLFLVAGIFLQCIALAAEPAKAPDSHAAPAAAPKAKATAIVIPQVKPAVKPVESAASRAREDALADQVAARIAERLAEIRREKAVRALNKPAARHSASASSAVHAKGSKEAPHRSAAQAHWAYEGEGAPIHWGQLNPAWALCGNGSRQSPIDIRDGIKVDLEPIVFDYKPTGFNVVDNGHTVQVNLGGGNHIAVMGRMYELLQFHFHRPSEERVNGKAFEMVVHLVHKDADGRLAVVAVLIEQGKAQNLIQSVWNNLPLEQNAAVTPALAMDVNQLLPTRREYFTYMGSLTTPPCSEGVLWMVMKEPVQASSEQIAIFARLYPMNARPLQVQAGRLIKESN